MIYPQSLTKLDDDLKASPDTPLTALARNLIERAKAFDLHKTKNLGMNGRIKNVVRDHKNPPTYTHDTVLGASWADNADHPLQPGEQWNAGRRATSTGTTYGFNQAGQPVNPYMETGMNGRGLLGLFGPNHAVDNGVLVIRNDDDGKPTLYAIGILRKFDRDPPAFSGGFAKYNVNGDGIYIFDAASALETQMEEFFEEMISGSITLLPEYHQHVERTARHEIQAREKHLQGRSLPPEAIHEIHEQAETALKLEQVRERDPGFFVRLKELIASGHECFAGPVLNDNRNTNNAWIESRLSWFLMDDAAWNKIKGDNPAFDCELSAGDDASGVVFHRLDAKLVEKAYASHGAMFTFMLASYLLESQKQNVSIEPTIIKQAEDIADFLAGYRRDKDVSLAAPSL